jgi:hypothetical protein
MNAGEPSIQQPKLLPTLVGGVLPILVKKVPVALVGDHDAMRSAHAKRCYMGAGAMPVEEGEGWACSS